MKTLDDRESLKALSQALAKVHKSLLSFQTEVQEALDEKRYTTYDVLHLSLNHPDYEWLRKLSMMIVLVDETIDDSEAFAHEVRAQVIQELTALFVDASQHEGFKKRIENALLKNPHLYIELAELKKQFGSKSL